MSEWEGYSGTPELPERACRGDRSVVCDDCSGDPLSCLVHISEDAGRYGGAPTGPGANDEVDYEDPEPEVELAEVEAAAARLQPLEHALYTCMSQLSEEVYAAGWLVDCEYDLWRLAHHGGTWGFSCACGLALDLSALRELAGHTGTWIVWRKEPVAVPLEEWLPLYEQRMSERRAKRAQAREEGRSDTARKRAFPLVVAPGCDRCRAADEVA
jgi:hypothetical protein